MVDPRSLQKDFKRAVASHDASATARLVSLPDFPAAKGAKPRKHDPVNNLMINDVDFGSFFVALLDAIAAAESVRYIYI